MLKKGFYTAAGTPIDASGSVIEKSLAKHLDDQVTADASGILLMGSMGAQACVRDCDFAKIVKIAEKTIAGRIPLFVGTMDNSAARVKDRLTAIEDCKIDGIVMTTPFYFVSPAKDIKNFFRMVAAAAKFPMYLYDLAGITKIKITCDMLLDLMDSPNLAGIKSGDITLARDLLTSGKLKPGFSILFAGVDICDVGYSFGLDKVLDGMFGCTLMNTAKMCEHMNRGDIKGGLPYQNNIIALRNLFVSIGVFPAFSYCMNLCGYEGYFSPDYLVDITDADREKLKAKMKEIGEI